MSKIVIIDSGVDRTIFQGIDGCSIIPNKDGGYSVSDDFQDQIGHGTAVCDIISKNCDAEIFMVRVYDDTFETPSTFLSCAFEYINTTIIDCDIIHISSGIQVLSNFKHLEEQINKLVEKGIIIISAFDNSGSLSYPAVFSNVIGIDASHEIPNLNQYLFLENSPITIISSLTPFRVQWVGGKRIIQRGSSFTAAFYCAQISKIIDQLQQGTLNGKLTKKKYVLETLKVRATNTITFPTSEICSIGKEFLGNGLKAIVFPFAKEEHSLAYFERLLPFTDITYYDIRQSGKIGIGINKLLSHSSNSKVIHDFDEIDWNSNFDIFVLGHCDALSAVVGRDLRKEIIKKCQEHSKRLYAFDNTDINSNYFFSPAVLPNHVNTSNMGKLWQLHTPVVGVYGTSSKQGKFTLQLLLREKFKSQSYNVGQISTEPSGYLFGADFVYPMGYNAAVQVAYQDRTVVLNEMLHLLELNEVDIILTGSQSATVTYDYTNVLYSSVSQYEFLTATCPDYVVLCVNYTDTTDYVLRTIRFIENAVECKVGAIVIFPSEQKVYANSRTGEVSKETKRQQFENLGVSTYVLDNGSDIDALFNNIITFFSEVK